MIFNHLKAAILIFLHLCLIINGQDTPLERCTAMVNGNVCSDCSHTDTCTNGILGSVTSGTTTACGAGEICDESIADGLCLPPISSAVSPICFCKEVGCFIDPNDPSAYVQCTATEIAGSNAPALPCDYADEQFSVETCECVPADCPDCGWIAGDDSVCPTTYYYCEDIVSVPNVFLCKDNTCYNSTQCHCVGVTTVCPTCGKYPDPDSTDSRGFCYCQDDMVADVCGAVCIEGTVFNEITCQCQAQ